jgi:hypothetical protein
MIQSGGIVLFGFLVAHLCETQIYDPKSWRMVFLAVACIYSGWLLISIICAVVNYVNNVHASNNTATDAKPATFVLPELRWGLIYISVFTTAAWLNWAYLDKMITETPPVDVLVEENDFLRMRIKLWNELAIVVVFMASWLFDMVSITDSLSWAGTEARCDYASIIPKNDPTWQGIIALWNVGKLLVLIGSMFLGTFSVLECYGELTWKPFTWRAMMGVSALVLLGLAVLLLIAYFTTCGVKAVKELACLRKHLMRSILFCLGFGFYFGTIWLYIFNFIGDGQDRFLTMTDRQRWDNLKFMTLIGFLVMTWLQWFSELRCVMNNTLRKAFCRNFTDL